MKTVIIKRDGCPDGCKINESDFIEGEMELFSASDVEIRAPLNFKKLTKDQIADLLNERDIEFDLSDLKADLVFLLEKDDEDQGN